MIDLFSSYIVKLIADRLSIENFQHLLSYETIASIVQMNSVDCQNTFFFIVRIIGF